MLGIKSPNPFWLASAPPTDKEYNVVRAFEAGWGGVVWKTLGEDPHIVNVYGPRYGALLGNDRRVIGFNNIELISDRPLQTNLDEIRRVKRAWPDRAVVVSIMVPCEEASWKRILPMVEDTGCDGIELNFGCPHGMSERGMGSSVGQVPEYIEMVARWCKTYTRLPVIVKLTPNITDIRYPARAAKQGGADAVSLINTINSVMGVNLETMTMSPSVGPTGLARRLLRHRGAADRAQHGGRDRARPADRRTADLGHRRRTHLARRGRIHRAGSGTVQVCTAAMVYGFRIVQDMCDGLSNFMDEQGYTSVAQMVGKAVPSITSWNQLNMNHVEKAVINQDSCIQCGRCHVVCEDTSHQAITATKDGKRHFEIKEEECVGCNLCVSICPVPDTITMRKLAAGEVDKRTGKTGPGRVRQLDHPSEQSHAQGRRSPLRQAYDGRLNPH